MPFFIVFLFKLLSGCDHFVSNDKIISVEVVDVDPLIGQTFYRVFYWRNLIMYQCQYRFDSSITRIGNNNSNTSSQWRNAFFVFHKDSLYGYNYYPNKAENNSRSRVDSVLNLIKGTNRFDSFLTVKPYSTIWDGDKTELKEVFLLSNKNDVPNGRFIMYYSKKLNHLKESFNKIVDSAKQMKLFRTETIFSEFYSEKEKKLWPALRNMTEMREIKINDSEIMNYFEKYVKM